MSLNVKLYHKLQQYLDNELSESEKKSFEDELDKNEELYKQYCFELEVSDRLEIMHFYNQDIDYKPGKKSDNPLDYPEYIRSLIGGKLPVEVKNDAPPKKTFKISSIKSKFFRYAASIAAILILVVAGYYFFRGKKEKDFSKTKNEQDLTAVLTKALKKDYYETMGLSNENINLNNLLKKGEYDRYIKESNKKLRTYSNGNDSIQLSANIARCYIFLDRADSALEFLSKISFIEQDTCDIQFVKSLALVKLNRFEDAKQILSMVKRACRSYQKDVDIIEDKLNKKY